MHQSENIKINHNDKKDEYSWLILLYARHTCKKNNNNKKKTYNDRRMNHSRSTAFEKLLQSDNYLGINRILQFCSKLALRGFNEDQMLNTPKLRPMGNRQSLVKQSGQMKPYHKYSYFRGGNVYYLCVLLCVYSCLFLPLWIGMTILFDFFSF